MESVRAGGDGIGRGGRRGAHWVGGTLLVAALCGVGWLVAARLLEGEATRTGPGRSGGPVAVDVAPIEVGTIISRRVFHGSLHARFESSVAAKISGRVVRVHVDIGDRIRRGALVAELEDAEHQQAVLEAEAEVAVAKARRAEARSAHGIALRELKRVEALEGKGIASDSELDVRRSDVEARQAALEVAESELQRQETLLVTAKIRRDYTRIEASWDEGDEERVVGERFVEEGDNVVAHEPIVTVLDISTVIALVTVTEADYGRLEIGQSATLAADAFPDRTFPARIARKAPLFRTESRQADVELYADNPEGALKPGMFIRSTVELGRAADATIVPELALATRDSQRGVFLVQEDGATVAWQPVQVGITDQRRVQVLGVPTQGFVVTLGQQLLSDGAPITIPGGRPAEADPSPE